MGSILLILFLSALVTSDGVTGTHGVNGWYGEYGSAAPVNGVRPPPGESGSDRSKTVCFVWIDELVGEASDDSAYARSGSVPPVRTADGALGREKEPARGVRGRLGGGEKRDARGEAGSVGKRFTPGLGD